MNFSSRQKVLVAQLFSALKALNASVATAESCTGGLIAALLTDAPGSSEFFERGFVTYSNEAKSEMLDVPAESIQNFGAVSEQVAVAMAEGAVKNSNAMFAVAVTGIAGPGGATTDKPVGLVYIGLCARGASGRSVQQNFSGDRNAVRTQTVETALTELIKMVENPAS
jgi:nicotinamide-nucleotide amidase